MVNSCCHHFAWVSHRGCSCSGPFWSDGLSRDGPDEQPDRDHEVAETGAHVGHRAQALRPIGAHHGDTRDRDPVAQEAGRHDQDTDEHETPRQRFHIEVYVAPEVAEQRIAAALAAGGTVVDDSNAHSLTVIADQDGNKGVVCVDVSAAKKE